MELLTSSNFSSPYAKILTAMSFARPTLILMLS
jgi:hypothetical protein